MSYIDQINKEKIPAHVAIIMDGNGRWAESHSKMRLSGHQEGAKSVKTALEVCGDLGIKFLTVYAFSTENWNRPHSEVNGLMSLLANSIDKEFEQIHRNKIRVRVIGQMDKLPTHLQSKLNSVIEKTKDNDALNFIIALSYSGRWDIVNAVKNIASDCYNQKISCNVIDNVLFEKYLSTDGIPDPELLIRTSGEERISNFLLYQLAYSELYFTNVLWPDFSKEDFYKAIIDYQNRERRFGKTSEQLT